MSLSRMIGIVYDCLRYLTGLSDHVERPGRMLPLTTNFWYPAGTTPSLDRTNGDISYASATVAAPHTSARSPRGTDILRQDVSSSAYSVIAKPQSNPGAWQNAACGTVRERRPGS